MDQASMYCLKANNRNTRIILFIYLFLIYLSLTTLGR